MAKDLDKIKEINSISENLNISGDRAKREKEMAHFFLANSDRAFKISFPSWEFEILEEISKRELDYPALENAKIERVWDTAKRLEKSEILRSVDKDTYALLNKEKAAKLVAIHESRSYK